MQTASEYNTTKTFKYEMKESRLLKCSKIIEGLSPGSLLDIGCSTGSWSTHWKARGWSAHGIDIDRKHIDIARENGVDARLCDLNADHIPFPNESFDLIFAGEVIEHLVDTDAFLGEIARCTKPGGAVIVTTPNLASFENRLRLVLGMYPAWLNYSLAGSGHVRGYTLGVLRRQMGDHGLKVVKQLGNWVPFIPQHFVDDIKIPLLSVTGDWFPSLSMGIIVMARKSTA